MKINNLKRKLIELEEKEKKDAECKDVLLKESKELIDYQKVQIDTKKREIELQDEYYSYLSGRIEAYEARQHFSDQIIGQLQYDCDWQRKDNDWLSNINDTNKVTIRNLQIENSQFR